MSADWRDAPIAIAGVLTDPEAAAKGEPGPFRVRARFPDRGTCIRRRGRAGNAPSAEGEMTGSAPSIAALAALSTPRARLSSPPTTSPPRERSRRPPTRSRSATRAHQRRADFRRGDRNRRTRRTTDRLGTLAAETLALEPLLGPPNASSTRPEMEREAVRAFAAAAFDLDLRLLRRASTSMAGSLPTRRRPSSSRTASQRHRLEAAA